MLHSLGARRSILTMYVLLAALALLYGCDMGPTPGPSPQPTATVQASPTAPGRPSVAATLPKATTITPAATVATAVTPEQPLSPTLTAQVAQPRPSTTSTSLAATELPQVIATNTLTPERITPTAQPSRSGQVEVVAGGFGSPDDLVVAPSGDIIFGDFGNNAVNIIGSNGVPRVLAGGLQEPEGLVVTKDGAIVVAEQKTNRILEIDMQTGKVKTLRQLENATGKDGVDGLGIDEATGDILIPDSPNGRLLRMSRDGSTLKTLATGFVRPTGAALEADGSILVADELGNTVYRLRPNGSRSRIATIYQPDDVIVGADGSIYVNSLGGDIVLIDPATLRRRVLISGLKLPHGLGIDKTGRLVIAEAGRNRIFRLTP